MQIEIWDFFNNENYNSWRQGMSYSKTTLLGEEFWQKNQD